MKTKVNKKQKYCRKLNKQGFTLIELIVVITILAILGTISFMAFHGYSKKAKDSTNITNISNINKSLTTKVISGTTLPPPSGSTTITFDGKNIITQGILDDNTISKIGDMSIGIRDAVTGKNFNYSLTNSGNRFQIGGAISNSNLAFNNVFADSENNFYRIFGNFEKGDVSYEESGKTKNIDFPSIIFSVLPTADLNISSKVYLANNNIEYNEDLTKVLDSYKPYTPKIYNQKIAVYYGWLSGLNAYWNNTKVIEDLGQYDAIVMGKGLEENSHGDYVNTTTILAGYNALPGKKSFGYVSANHNIATIKTAVDNWKTLGATGIFFDEFGYDYLIDAGTFSDKPNARIHQNAAIDYAHSQNMNVFVNGWNVDDIFGTNSGQEPTHLKETDGYMFESFVYTSDGTTIANYSYDDQINKINKYNKYNEDYNVNTICLGLARHNSDITSGMVNKFKEKTKNFCHYEQITNQNMSSEDDDNGKLINFLK